MAVAEVRTQISLNQSQHEALKRMATRRSVSMAQIVREAIARYLVEPSRTADTTTERQDAAWSLLDVAHEIGGSGTKDGAERLEEELYGPVEC
jgi:hypothetical protein